MSSSSEVSFILTIVVYVAFVLTSSIVSLLAMFNAKKIKKIIRVDKIISCMGLYLSNFFISYYFFEDFNVYARVAPPLALLLIAVKLSTSV